MFIWESSNLLLLVPVVIGLVVLVRWLQGRVVFTEDGIGCCALDSRARRSSHCVEFRYKLWLIR